MKAVRLIAPGRALELQEVAVPAPGPHDVLVCVRAAGICHSDVHYRAGVSSTRTPVTLGHEIAGTIERVGESIFHLAAGERVCVHYLATCGACGYCRGGHEQFCGAGQMVGKHRDGGFAEFVVLPAASVLPLPDAVSFAHGAVMMCSSATSLHALRKARFAAGETVAVFGVGGLGASAVQLARALGVSDHLWSELPELLALAARGALDLSRIVTRTVPLDVAAINGVLDELERFGNADVRTVVTSGA